MSKTSKTSLAPGAKPPEMPFEDALKKLEGIVEEMESDELPLETLLTRFEEGCRLASLCQAKLTDAELKIQRLEQSAGGEAQLKPFDTGPSDEA